MSELFYRLRSQTNVAYYMLSKTERKLKVVDFIKQRFLKVNEIVNSNKPKPEKELGLLIKSEEVLIEFDKIDFTQNNLDSVHRQKLADECITLQSAIFIFVRNEIKGINYATMSNDEFEKIVHQENTKYLFIALYLNECWAKLLEFRLNRI